MLVFDVPAFVFFCFAVPFMFFLSFSHLLILTLLFPLCFVVYFPFVLYTFVLFLFLFIIPFLTSLVSSLCSLSFCLFLFVLMLLFCLHLLVNFFLLFCLFVLHIILFSLTLLLIFLVSRFLPLAVCLSNFFLVLKLLFCLRCSVNFASSLLAALSLLFRAPGPRPSLAPPPLLHLCCFPSLLLGCYCYSCPR